MEKMIISDNTLNPWKIDKFIALKFFKIKIAHLGLDLVPHEAQAETLQLLYLR